MLGKYVLVRPMARGGMGELFVAASGETDGFEKLCVVKKVLHSVDDQAVHRRFLDEAKVVVRLNHPNLVQVFDAGQVNDEFYLAMELVEGKDLRAVWNRCAQLHRRIAVDVAIYVVRECLRGLEYAHDAGSLDLVHRDISPPNILVGYRGDVKLTDFGLAKSAIKKEMTTPGVVFGRYSYLSPEQARGLSADRRTDLYACGIVLWELLTGRQLFPSTGRNHQEALAAVRDPKVKRPSELVPGVPEGLDDVVLQALAKEPNDRYQNAGAFRTALSDVLSEHFRRCDADRTAEFMRDIFAREVRTEARDLSDLSQTDFQDVRSSADPSQAISIDELLASETSATSLRDSDIVELDKSHRGRERPSADDLAVAAEEWVGRIVGKRYRVDRLIGIGGMGAVFCATHMALGKTFALKVLHQVYTRDADIVDRFMREARAATQTGHPNIIDVVDIGTTDDDDVYVVMELLEGRTLAEVLDDEGPLAVRRAVHIARQICRALSATHEVGIIHRDLKTDNIILTTVGKDPDFVKVLDFGICKSVADSGTTSPGMIMGSPDYMAPEQGAGLPATVTSDVYAAGCVLFEMLAGQLPFSGRNAIDVLMQKGSRDADLVTAFRPEVPDAVSELLARCLARVASERPQSMRSLEYDLTRAVDGRAQAVAAVLGLNMAGDSDPRGADPNPAASASFHRAAIESLDLPGGGGRQERTVVSARPQERTVVAHAPSGPTSGPTIAVRAPSEPAAESASSLSRANANALAAVKAVFFVLLGGAVASAVVIGLRPDPEEPSAVDDSVADDAGAVAAVGPGETSPRLDAGSPAATVPVVPAPDVPPVSTDPPPVAGTGGTDSGAPDGPDVGSGSGGGDGGTVAADAGEPDIVIGEDDGVAELVAEAERALAAKQWREPLDSSVAMALTTLKLRDPGNEAIARIRGEARDALLPAGEQAASKRRWGAAVTAYRDLLAVWPDHPARTDLVDALHNQGRVLAKHKDWEPVLATADELLNYSADDFRAHVLRGDAMYGLARYAEARDAFSRAVKLKPRNKPAKKKRSKAARKARQAAG